MVQFITPNLFCPCRGATIDLKLLTTLPYFLSFLNKLTVDSKIVRNGATSSNIAGEYFRSFCQKDTFLSKIVRNCASIKQQKSTFSQIIQLLIHYFKKNHKNSDKKQKVINKKLPRSHTSNSLIRVKVK